jgi:hypothetical protein
MKGRIFGALVGLAALALFLSAPWQSGEAQGRSGDQQMARLRFVSDGEQTRGSGVLQTGQVGNLSAVVANTLTQVVAAPAAGQTVILGVWIESAVATTAVVDVKYGTGTNCATGTTTLASLKASTSNPLMAGYYPLPVRVPAAKATCLVTEAAGTTARLITQ